VSGHAVGAETPRAESLIVHYDTTVDSVASGTAVVDTSGNGINGTLTNGAAYSSSEHALTFDRANDYLTGSITASGNYVHSVSMWFKPDVVDSSVQMLFFMSSNGGTNLGRSIIYFDTGNGIAFDFRSKSVRHLTAPTADVWTHLVCTYDGNVDGSGSDDMKIYINGIRSTNVLVSGASSTLNLIDGTFWVGNTTGSGQHFGGSISNFKLWDVALTADEVAMEYALGRTGKALNIADTAVCLGGTAPRAQLDVRGTGMFDTLDVKVLHREDYIVGTWKTSLDASASTTIKMNVGSCVTTPAATGSGMSGNVGRFTAPVTGYYYTYCHTIQATRSTSNLLVVYDAGGTNWGTNNVIGTYDEIIDLRNVANHEEVHTWGATLYMEVGDYIGYRVHSSGYTDSASHHIQCSAFLLNRV